MNWQWNFSISLKIFFAWNVLKHKVKPKNSRNSTFFKKLKFPPYFWKTLVKFSSFFHGNRLIFGWWLKADKKPSKSRRLKSRLSVSATSYPLFSVQFRVWPIVRAVHYKLLSLYIMSKLCDTKLLWLQWGQHTLWHYCMRPIENGWNSSSVSET